MGTLGTISTITVAGRVFTKLPESGLIILQCWASTIVGASTGRQGVSTAGYQVTGGKTLYISALRASIEGANPGFLVPGYADNDVGFDTNGSPTNQHTLGGKNAAPPSAGFYINSAGSGFNGMVEVSFDLQVPATKFPLIRSDGAFTGSVWLFGYEL